MMSEPKMTIHMHELAERYATPLPALADEVEALSTKVSEHLKRMGVI
jgi:type I restriction enzyme M protein